MIRHGEVDRADHRTATPHPVIVVSREALNRGRYVLAVMITSARFSVRSTLPHCVPIRAGEFGLTKDFPRTVVGPGPRSTATARKTDRALGPRRRRERQDMKQARGF
jgi:mRNA-degrading endonuclease toxin of MazEF toxin-antitoxin module